LRKIIIHIIPENGKLKEYMLTPLTQKLLWFLLIVILGSFVYIGMNYGKIIILASREKMMERENARLKEKFKKIKYLEETFARFKKLSDKLTVALGVSKQPTSAFNSEPINISTKTSSSNVSDTTSEEKNLLQYVPNIWPVRGFISQGFKPEHKAIDIAAEEGTAIMSPINGKVIFSGWDNIYGNMIKIKNKEGFTLLFGHNKKNLVKRGDYVKKGDVIGFLGSTGRSSAPHLHYAIYMQGRPLNPLKFLQGGT